MILRRYPVLTQAIFPASGSDLRKGSRMILAFCWISGVLSGAAVFASDVFLFSSLVGRAVTERLSWTESLSTVLVPVFLSAAALFLCVPLILFLVCFGKAFLFGLLSAGVLYSFGSAGWLIRALFLFCDFAGMPILYVYWLRSLDADDTAFLRFCHFLLVMAVFLGLWYADVRIITPILARLIDF